MSTKDRITSPPRSNSPDVLCAWAFRFAVLATMIALLGVGQANGVIPSLATIGKASAAPAEVSP